MLKASKHLEKIMPALRAEYILNDEYKTPEDCAAAVLFDIYVWTTESLCVKFNKVVEKYVAEIHRQEKEEEKYLEDLGRKTEENPNA